MVSAIELLGVSRASASGVICGGADVIASYDILGWHQVSHWKPFMPAFTLLLTFMCLTSFQVLDEHSCGHATVMLACHYTTRASPPNRLSTASLLSFREGCHDGRSLGMWLCLWHSS
jgi:hypothetical protein